MNEEKECSSCEDGECPAKKQMEGEDDKEFQERQLLNQRLCQIKHTIMVLSGKGGVGKSTVAVNLAAALSQAGKRTGLMDIDVHGPSIPRLLGLNGAPVAATENSLLPVRYDSNLKVMSIGFLVKNKDDAVIWRGPMKYGVIKQFLRDVEWGELDYLIVDSPPGTGDEPLSIAQLIPSARGAVIVTTPQELAIEDVRRSIQFCRKLDLPILGVIENMSGFVCPHCGQATDIFSSGGGEKMAAELKVPFLGAVPVDPEFVSSGDKGTPLISAGAKGGKTTEVLSKVIEPLLKLDA